MRAQQTAHRRYFPSRLVFCTAAAAAFFLAIGTSSSAGPGSTTVPDQTYEFKDTRELVDLVTDA